MKGAVEDDGAERSLLDGLLYYLAVSIKYRRFIATVTAAVAACAAAFCALSLLLPPERSPLPNVYAAQANILIQPNGQADLAQSILGGLGYEQGAGFSSGFDNGDLVLEVLNSRKIIDRVIEEFDMVARYRLTGNVKGKSRKIFLGKSAFDYSRNTGSLKISYEDIDPVFSQRVVNRLVALLDEWFNLNRGLAKEKQKTLLEEKLTEVKGDIASIQDRLKALQRKYGVLNVQDLGSSQSASLASLRTQLILKEIEIKNYSSFSKVNDPQLAQLTDERQTLLDLIDQTQSGMAEASHAASGKISLPDVAQEFSQLTLELEVQQRIFNTLSPQYEAAKLTPEASPVFQVLELAEVPDTKARPKRVSIVATAALLGLALSVAASLAHNAILRIRSDPSKRRYFE